MKSGLEAPPPETTISSSVIPSSPAIASTLCFIVSAIASRIDR